MDGQNIFYHYTSINSLYNIIMSRELWLTNLKSSNDIMINQRDIIL